MTNRLMLRLLLLCYFQKSSAFGLSAHTESPGRPARRYQQNMSADADAMEACAAALMEAGDHTVAAAAILGENQCHGDDPGRLSAGGCALANAGRDVAAAAEALAAREWGDAVFPLYDCSGNLFGASASLEEIGGCGAALGEAGAETEDASSVTGCIVLAAAAGPSLVSAGDSIRLAGGALTLYGQGMREDGGKICSIFIYRLEKYF